MRGDAAGGVIRAPLNGTPPSAPRVIVEAAGQRLMVARTGDGLRAYDAACPHYGLDLADGGADHDRAFCPGCALAFDLTTGRSVCASLTLRSHEVWEDGGVLCIRPSAGPPSAARNE